MNHEAKYQVVVIEVMGRWRVEQVGTRTASQPAWTLSLRHDLSRTVDGRGLHDVQPLALRVKPAGQLHNVQAGDVGLGHAQQLQGMLLLQPTHACKHIQTHKYKKMHKYISNRA